MIRRLVLLVVASVMWSLAAGASAAEPQRWALLVGVNDYNQIERLRYCSNDMTALRDELVGAGFPKDHVTLLNDEAKDNRFRPFKANIERQLDLMLSLAEEGDLLVVAFSGHGVFLDGTSYLCATEATLEDPAGTMVSMESVYERLEACPAALKLLLVDACRNDPRPGGQKSLRPTKSTTEFAGSLEKPPQGILVLTSCAPGQISMEEEKLGHGVFMNYLLAGLRGDADRENGNSDGRVSLLELYGYAGRRTKLHIAKAYNEFQTPTLKGELTGDYDLALGRAPEPKLPPPEPQQPAGESLFNGRDLSGWTVDSGDPNSWRVENGELVVNANTQSRGWLLTDKSYGDFKFRFEFQMGRGANSGVAFRGLPGEGSTDAKFAEVQLLDDVAPVEVVGVNWQTTGGLYFQTIDRRARLNPPGEWNQMELELIGSRLKVTVNGGETLDTDLDRFVYALPPTPGMKRDTGRIGLQSHEGTVRFRNLIVQPIANAGAKPRQVAPPPPFTSLFNGRDWTGWRLDGGDPNAWRIEQGAIVVVGTPENRGWLVTAKPYGDFVFRTEFQLTAGGNSGVGLRMNVGDPIQAFPEVQVLDEAHSKWRDTLQNVQRTGALYALALDAPAELRPLGSWNRLEIEVKGQRMRAAVNGKTTFLADLHRYISFRPNMPGLVRKSGLIGLQNSDGTIRYRNLEIQSFDAP